MANRAIKTAGFYGDANALAPHEAAHMRALSTPNSRERPHVELYRVVRELADLWDEDGYASEYIADIARAAIKLLSMDSGALDCGIMDSYYREVLRRTEGVNE